MIFLHFTTSKPSMHQLFKKNHFNTFLEPPAPEPEPEIPYECRDTATPMNDDGRGNAVYLDRHDVNCNDGEALAGFKLQRKAGGGKYQIKYKCCKLPAAGTSKQVGFKVDVSH